MLDWPINGFRRASISNFGAGGANTHVIIEDPQYLVRGWEYGKDTASSEGSVVSGTEVESGYHSASEESFTNEKNGSPQKLSSSYTDSAANCAATRTIETQLEDHRLPGGHETAETTQGEDQPGTHADPSLIFTLSARDETSLRASAAGIADYLDQWKTPSSLTNLASTMNSKRTHFPWRLAVRASTKAELQERLRSETLRPLNSSQVPRLGFVFTGQGAQWYGMGRELINSYPLYRETLEEAGGFMRSLGAKWDPIGKIGLPKHGYNLCMAYQY